MSISFHRLFFTGKARTRKTRHLQCVPQRTQRTHKGKDEVERSQGALIGSWFVTTSVTERFSDAYRKRFGNDAVLSGAAVHYDLSRILKGIADKKARGREIVELLRTAQVTDGALGSYAMKRTSNDQYLDIQLVLKEITPSGFRLLHE